MADNEVENAGEEELLDYDEEVQETAGEGSGEGDQKKDVKGTYVSIHSSGFRDFLLKPELLRAIVDCSPRSLTHTVSLFRVRDLPIEKSGA